MDAANIMAINSSCPIMALDEASAAIEYSSNIGEVWIDKSHAEAVLKLAGVIRDRIGEKNELWYESDEVLVDIKVMRRLDILECEMSDMMYKAAGVDVEQTVV